MLVTFFDDVGIVHREFVPTGTSVTAAFYMDILTRLLESVRRKRPQKWKNDWALHHDNVPSHTAMAVQQFLAKNNIPIVPHPPCSPDLAPSDFWLFPTLKMGLRLRRFAKMEDIKENADGRLRTTKKDVHQCYNNWIDRWNKCVYADGKYFEGDQVCKSWFSHNEDLYPHSTNFLNAPCICTSYFNIYEFLMVPRLLSDYFPIQNSPIYLCNGDATCLQAKDMCLSRIIHYRCFQTVKYRFLAAAMDVIL
jgi:hypothetical protein